MSIRTVEFWPVYKHLEKEVLELSYSVQFNDQHLNVYSLKIAELFLRCVTEIESISQTICREELIEMKNQPNFHSHILPKLTKKWGVDKKVVCFSCQEAVYIAHIQLKPFEKGIAKRWWQDYNAIKHDRAKNMEVANLNNLFNALAGLYLLNVYLMDITFSQSEVSRDYNGNFELISMGSNMFAILITDCYFYWQMKEQKRNFDMEDQAVYLLVFEKGAPIGVLNKNQFIEEKGNQ